jgi:hypothetical protein
MAKNSFILADAHVHIYDCFNPSDFFDSSFKNFDHIVKEANLQHPVQNVLLLTESSGYNSFAFLRQVANGRKQLDSRWFIQETPDNCSLILESRDKTNQLFLFAGSQIVTAEDLEVLALLTTVRIPDGLPFRKTIEQVLDSGGLPVIPWGFGKWLGRRGRILHDFLTESDPEKIFLGDNSGRPSFWKYSPLFEEAKKKNIKILPGTDPLPFPNEVKRPGKFAFLLNGHLEPDQPAKSLRNILLSTREQPITYGTLEKPLTFLYNQIKMQVEKRRRKRIS